MTPRGTTSWIGPAQPPPPPPEHPKPVTLPATAGADAIVAAMLREGYCVVTGLADAASLNRPLPYPALTTEPP